MTDTIDHQQAAVPDEAIEAATGVELGDLNETVEAPWHLQPEEARRVLEAALPHLVPDMSGEDFYVRPRQQHSKHVL